MAKIVRRLSTLVRRSGGARGTSVAGDGPRATRSGGRRGLLGSLRRLLG